MTTLSHDRWRRMLFGLGKEASDDEFAKLCAAYDEPHRHYHNARHIVECLEAFDSARHLAQDALAIEVAIWFHDVVYEIRSGANEERSADWAREFLTKAGVERTRIDRVEQLIMVTLHNAQQRAGDAALMADVDIAILGSAPERYAEFEQAIRREYAAVPWETYCEKRCEVLRSFLDRDAIYTTEFFRERRESQARRNLADAIENCR